MKLPNGYGSVTKMSGNRRKPWRVRKTIGYRYDPEKDKQIQEFILIGYASTKAEGLQMLASYNNEPYDTKKAKMTFKEVYDHWSAEKYPTVSESNVHAYKAAYNTCTALHSRVFKELKLVDLQQIIDTCGKNYPTLKKIKILFSQMYDFAMKNEICNKDYSDYVDIVKFKDKNPNKRERDRFSSEELEKFWAMKDEPYFQIILMLVYNGCRVSEFLDLKKENVHLDEQYFDVIKSKTENGLRRVPIADKMLPFYKAWYERHPECPYLLSTVDGQHFTYRNYYDSYFAPLIEQLDIPSNRTPHWTRHTCTSLMADAGIDPSVQKKILGHSGSMTLTEKVYTHFDVQILIDAINTI